MASDSVNVTINGIPDNTSPVFLNNVPDTGYTVGTTGHTIIWIVGDKNPLVYNATIDGAPYVSTDTWINGSILVNVDGLPVGIYEITIYSNIDPDDVNKISHSGTPSKKNYFNILFVKIRT